MPTTSESTIKARSRLCHKSVERESVRQHYVTQFNLFDHLNERGKVRGMLAAVLASECSNTTDCSLSVFAGFSGSDRHSVSLTTGLQLSKISQFALSTYFFNALAQVHVNEPVGQWWQANCLEIKLVTLCGFLHASILCINKSGCHMRVLKQNIGQPLDLPAPHLCTNHAKPGRRCQFLL